MTSYYVTIPAKHVKLLKILSTSSRVKFVTIALTVFKPHPSQRRLKKNKPGMNRVKPIQTGEGGF